MEEDLRKQKKIQWEVKGTRSLGQEQTSKCSHMKAKQLFLSQFKWNWKRKATVHKKLCTSPTLVNNLLTDKNEDSLEQGNNDLTYHTLYCQIFRTNNKKRSRTISSFTLKGIKWHDSYLTDFVCPLNEPKWFFHWWNNPLKQRTKITNSLLLCHRLLWCGGF